MDVGPDESCLIGTLLEVQSFKYFLGPVERVGEGHGIEFVEKRFGFSLLV